MRVIYNPGKSLTKETKIMKKKISTLISLLLTATLILSTPLTTFAAEPTLTDEILVEDAVTDSTLADDNVITEPDNDTIEPLNADPDSIDSNAISADNESDTDPYLPSETTDNTEPVANDTCAASADPENNIIYQDSLITMYAPDPDEDPEDSENLSDSDSIACDALAASGVTYTSDETEIYNRIMALETKYPEHSPWGYDKTWSGKTVNEYGQNLTTSAKACAAFALTVQDEVFGDAPRYWTPYDENHRPTYNDLHVGDYVGMGNHAQILIKKTPTQLLWVSGNNGGLINWDTYTEDKWPEYYTVENYCWISPDYVLEHLDKIVSCQPRYFTCSFNTLGGPTVNPITTDVYGYVTLPEPKWAGHTFDGWYTSEEKAKNTLSTSGKIKSNPYEMHKNITLYARWKSGSTPTPSQPKLTSVQFSASKIDLAVGASQPIVATITPADADVNARWDIDINNADKPIIEWDSTPDSPNNGKARATINGINPGTATVTINVTDNNYGNTISKSIKVHVANSLEPTACVCFVGEQMDVNQRFFEGHYPVKTGDYMYTAKYTNEISLNSDGILTAKKAGHVTINVRSRLGGDICESIDLTILPKPILKFTKPMSYVNQKISVYDCFTNLDDPLYADAVGSIKFVSFTSSKPAVASIDKDGNITAVSSGTTSITVCVADKNIAASGAKKTVNVKASLSVKVPQFAKTVYTMKTGQKLAIAMKNVTANSGAAFSSSDPDLVTATAEIKKDKPTGKVVLNAVNASADTDSITLTATIDGQNYTVPVTIVKPKINAATKTLKVKKTFTVKLSNTSYKVADIQWISTDPSVATVASNGKITAVSPGTTTVYTEKGGIRNECIITVTK